MTTQVTLTGPNETAADVWAGIGAEPIEGVTPTFPEIRLVQKATPKIPESGKHGGDFWFSDSGVFTPELMGVFIQATGVRSLFAGEELGAPLCSSNDGRVPRANQPLWELEHVILKDIGKMEVPETGQPATCAECVFAFKGCNRSFLVLFENEDGSLYRMRFSGMGYPEMRNFLSRLAGEGMNRKSRRVGKPVYSKVVTITSEEARRADLLWYEPRITVEGPVDPAEAEGYEEFAAALRSQFRQDVELSHGAGDAPGAAPEWGDGSEPFVASTLEANTSTVSSRPAGEEWRELVAALRYVRGDMAGKMNAVAAAIGGKTESHLLMWLAERDGRTVQMLVDGLFPSD